MIKAIIFDCFGVVRTDSFSLAYRKLGGDPYEDREFIQKILEESNSGRILSSRSAVAAHLKVPESVWSNTLESNGSINYELLEYVQTLRNRYKVGMLSNIGKGGLSRFFEPGFLECYFDDIVSSGDIGFAKPEARAYEISADRLSVRLSECIFIDDRQECVDGAVSVGMIGLLYRDFGTFKIELSRALKNNSAH